MIEGGRRLHPGGADSHYYFQPPFSTRFEEAVPRAASRYPLNQRNDTAYWRENAAGQLLSGNLKAMITAWFTHGGIGEANLARYDRPAYLTGSWHCLFAGYGAYPPSEKMQAQPDHNARLVRKRVRDMLGACALNFEAVTRCTPTEQNRMQLIGPPT